jgi:hypothetical protein
MISGYAYLNPIETKRKFLLTDMHKLSLIGF